LAPSQGQPTTVVYSSHSIQN